MLKTSKDANVSSGQTRPPWQWRTDKGKKGGAKESLLKTSEKTGPRLMTWPAARQETTASEKGCCGASALAAKLSGGRR